MCIGHLLVPGVFAPAFGYASRPSCQFVDIHAEVPFQALVHNHSLVPYGLK